MRRCYFLKLPVRSAASTSESASFLEADRPETAALMSDDSSSFLAESEKVVARTKKVRNQAEEAESIEEEVAENAKVDQAVVDAAAAQTTAAATAAEQVEAEANAENHYHARGETTVSHGKPQSTLNASILVKP